MATFDLVIRGGTVFDGTGAPGVQADIHRMPDCRTLRISVPSGKLWKPLVGGAYLSHGVCSSLALHPRSANPSQATGSCAKDRRAAKRTALAFGSPCGAPSSSTRRGEVDEDCSSPAVRRVVCASPGRVPQSPRRGRQHRVTPEKGRGTGAAFFWFLFLAAQEK